MKASKDALKTEEERKDRSRSSYSELPEDEDSSPVKTMKKESRKGNKENRELRILKRSKTLKEKNDPDRFSGEGINFKAKIIGTEHVFDARGNRMCQGALQRLKAAVKTSGDHKQRIILNISFQGIIIKDEKTGEPLHHHPIHKISFISQDTSDSRAFGYVFGCPQSGHRFFAIKTEKTASQVVVTLRDLFLAALEIKKKEIEKAIETQKDDSESSCSKDNFEEKPISNGCSMPTPSNSATVVENGYSNNSGVNHELLYSNTVFLPEETDVQKKDEASPENKAEPVIDNLLDLQFEMDTLQQGISQMDNSIASAVTQGYGFSFSEDDVSESSCGSVPTPFHFKLDKLSSLYQETLSVSSRSSSTSDYNICNPENKSDDIEMLRNEVFGVVSPVNPVQEPSATSSGLIEDSNSYSEISDQSNATSSNTAEDRYAVFLDIDSLPSIFDNPDIVKSSHSLEKVELLCSSKENISNTSNESSDIVTEVKSSTPIVFAELDPLGSQPYVDKKDFFCDIKNPPKKVLKDLVGDSSEHFPSSVESDSSELCQASLKNDSLSNPTASDLHFTFEKKQQFNPFSEASNLPAPATPPKLPPKKSACTLPTIPLSSQTNGEYEPATGDAAWGTKNPFNPFAIEDFPDIPPPNSPPPPPPPRLPTKPEYPISMSPPPPRPPSRTNGVPTPPLPRRKMPIANCNRSWFSFDQDAASMSSIPSNPDIESHSNQFSPPIPSPARKIAPCKLESTALKSSSASNSPATIRRLHNQSPLFGNSSLSRESRDATKHNNVNKSPHKMLSRHSSILQESDTATAYSLFVPSNSVIIDECSEKTESSSHSPPLPPKPVSISRPRPSPSKKMLATAKNSSSSHYSSNISGTETANSTHSSSSLVFSSVDECKSGSSSEALFVNSTGSQSDVFSQSSQEQSSRSPEEKPCELSPDSIFRRKSDPFADDFFLSLPKRSSCDSEPFVMKNSLKQNCSNGVEANFEDLKAPT
ncbi:protein disabled-like [Uloborus diversus]|uniref:protein disabled-like n=1 Tax=Uloborus diversus TaxID=327109 RepID=UPI002409DFCB|nr:protein disabled-like [Uloborus diversus]